ncbi:MAG: hypothetical protein ACHQ49_12550 [Elusimicrobiota bacterium]
MIRILTLAIIAGSATAAFSAPAASRFTDKQLEAQFSFDLGPDSVDVSSYPKVQQDNYAVFASVCSRCHTLARPINAPIVSREDWRRFISRMHIRSKVQSDKTFTKEQAKAVVDFLAYDSHERKVLRKADFDAETQRLVKLFSEVRAERARVQGENDARKAKPYGDQPSATPRP